MGPNEWFNCEIELNDATITANDDEFIYVKGISKIVFDDHISYKFDLLPNDFITLLKWHTNPTSKLEYQIVGDGVLRQNNVLRMGSFSLKSVKGRFFIRKITYGILQETIFPINFILFATEGYSFTLEYKTLSKFDDKDIVLITR